MVLSYFPTGASDSTAGEGRNLELTSWADISSIAKSGDAKKYFSIGDTKSFIIGDYTYHARIIDFEHDEPDPSFSYGRERTGISFDVVELLPDLSPFSTTTSTNDNVVCWGGATTSSVGLIESTIRHDVLPNVFASLPTDLSSVIVPVYKKYYAHAAGVLLKCIDKLHIPSLVELGYTSFWNASLAEEGEVYALYSTMSRYQKVKMRVAGLDTSTNVGKSYWTRSQGAVGTGSNNNPAVSVNYTGYSATMNCTSTAVATSFSFCV